MHPVLPAYARLMPREHGAYVQLGAALAVGLMLAQGHPRAWFQAVSSLALFLLGSAWRTPERHPWPVARSWCGLWALVALGSAGMAWRGASESDLRIMVVPALLAGLLAGLLRLQRAHTLPGTLVSAWTFASAALPIAVLGGAPLRQAWACTLILAGLQTIGTLAVQAHLIALRSPRHRPARFLPPLLGLAMASGWRLLDHPLHEALALLPMVAATTALALRAPGHPSLKHIGWTLTVAAAGGVWILLG